MNIIQMKCAVEIARAGSINKAADFLLIAQPNLSKTIRELEDELGIKIFLRSSRGMSLTPEGEEFIGYAKKILKQIEDVEKLYKDGGQVKHSFAVSAPRASYISDAFANFTKHISEEAVELVYNETNSMRAIDNIVNRDYNLGIIRYAECYERYFSKLLEDKELVGTPIVRFQYVLVMNKNSSLAKKEQVLLSDLAHYTEIAHADPYVPSLPISVVKKQELTNYSENTIFVYERGSQFDLLSLNPNTYMWVSPIPQRVLDNCGLVQRECPESSRVYKDVLVYKKNYRFSRLDRLFVEFIEQSKAII